MCFVYPSASDEVSTRRCCLACTLEFETAKEAPKSYARVRVVTEEANPSQQTLEALVNEIQRLLTKKTKLYPARTVESGATLEGNASCREEQLRGKL
ncbi:unnamed protein product [Acanthoscelides obtectus]|uniref:Uncharacterized protein n=1 Tax=Acanthoscelides obtectus TaxID=200917 RepID=A0A9P0LN17_ACAOB|nr:unnamed protein product [Acanthoscelides obtectus]CAK1621687.1 hypothetical protein AOBTE_LOCUS1081 [Acanthoscelides obtectus]